MSQGKYCSGCKQTAAKLDKNGYCSRCYAQSFGASIGNVAYEHLEKFAIKFMPKWLFKLLMTVVIGVLLYFFMHK